MNLQAEIEDNIALVDEFQRISRGARSLAERVLYHNRAENLVSYIKQLQKILLKQSTKGGKHENIENE